MSQHKIRLLLAFIVALIAIRVALPHGIEWYVNRTLDRDPSYDGRIDDVDLYLILGMYSIDLIDIVRTDGDAPVPFFKAERVDLSIQWKALLKGSVVGEIDVIEPVVNFAVTKGGGVQDGGEADWREIVLDLFPVTINRLAIHDGTVRYLDVYSAPEVDLTISSIQAEARNLTNVDGRDESMAADFDASAIAMTSGQVTVHGRLDPYADVPDFDVDVSLRQLQLTELNPWLDAYAKFDVNQGTLDTYLEMQARNGSFEGYVKPLLRDVDILDGEDWREDKPLRVAWEAIVGSVKSIFSNPKKKQVASVIPMEGRLDDPKVGVWRALGRAVQNALLEVLRPGFEKSAVDGTEVVDPEPQTREERKEERAEKREERREERERAKAE